MSEATVWQRCNTCKREITHGSVYYVCSVSTCNKKRSPYRFCSVDCWDAHVPVAGHRSATAIEERAPWAAESDGPPRRVVRTGTGTGVNVGAREEEKKSGSRSSSKADSKSSAELLVVASRLKSYIREQSGMNTSDSALEVLSEHLRKLAQDGIRNARADGRKTVMDRDIPPVVEPL